MPDLIKSAVRPWNVTGNHYLSIPCIDPDTGAVDRMNVLHRGAGGLLEWAGSRVAGEGAPLLAPRFVVDGVESTPADLAWERLERWIPRYRASLAPALAVTGTVCAPGGAEFSYPGAVYLMELENAGEAAREVEVVLDGRWSWSLTTIRTTRPGPGGNRLWLAEDPAALVLERAGASLAIGAGDGAGYDVAGAAGAPLAPGGELERRNGEELTFRVTRSVRLDAGGRAVVAFYVGAAVERDGALGAVAYMMRVGAAELVREARLGLARLARRVPDTAMGALLNRNLLFNFFFALGRAIDDDRFYPCASRSPLHPRAATFSERDALLWSLPALTLADPPSAREALLQAFERYSHQPGQALRYLDGGILAPGFALDQCCAYIVALDRYVEETNDGTVLDEPLVQQVLRELQEVILSRLHPEVFLCATELLPSGDPPVHPYVTYDNVLLAAAARALERVWVAGDAEDRPALDGADDEVAAAIWRHATAEVDGLRVLAWSADLEGESAVYDDPAGSLQLLPFHGFCDADDPVWRNTVELLRSEAYPLWLGDAAYPGLASRDRPDSAGLAAVCADLLGSRADEARDLLRRLPLDGGFACEYYDPATGLPAAGRHHAALAGFLAWALWRTLER